MSIALPKPHKGGQRALYEHQARFKIVACGRRWGKTLFGKISTVSMIFERGLDVWWVSPTYKMSGAIWREFKRTFGKFATRADGSDRVMEFKNGATLTIWTGNQADTMRGGAPGIAIIDEAAMITDPDMWPAVIRPALTDHRGGALFLSTPRGHNWFWELFNRGNDPAYPDYKSWSFPTSTNPFLPSDEIDEARRTLPDRFFRQEYLAEFIDDAGGVFRGVRDASTGEIMEPYDGRFVMGVDWAKSMDFTVLSVIDTETKRQVDKDRFNKISWSLQRARLTAMYERWKPYTIIAEENSIGGPNIEALQQEGLPVRAFTTTAQSKGPLIESLALAIERGDITLLNDRAQIAELQAYEMERLPSGRFRYGAPDGAHDDMVIAVALAWHGANNTALGAIRTEGPGIYNSRRAVPRLKTPRGL